MSLKVHNNIIILLMLYQEYLSMKNILEIYEKNIRK